MILSHQSIKVIGPSAIQPFEEQQLESYGMSYGLGPASYDVRIGQRTIVPIGAFVLASTFEYVHIPPDIMVRVADKSSWARLGLAVQNTMIDPGFRGYITLEITNHSNVPYDIPFCAPICQLIFEKLDAPTDKPYSGKYQDQKAGPQMAKLS